MEFKDIKEVLSFAAFRPEADNPNFSWPQRFPKRKSVIININKGHCSWAYLDKKGNVSQVDEAEGEFPTIISQMGDDWKNNTEDGWVQVSLNNRFIINLEHNLSRKKGWEDEIRISPKAILGTKYDRSKRYAMHHNLETSASLLMACDDSMIKQIEEELKAHNLTAARICVGLFGMTSHLLNRISHDDSFKNQDLIVITWSHGSLCVLKQKAGQWKELRCRSGLPIDDEAALAMMVRPFIEGAEPTTRVLFMGDTAQSPHGKAILSMFGSLHVTDVTEDNNLWNILAKN